MYFISFFDKRHLFALIFEIINTNKLNIQIINCHTRGTDFIIINFIYVTSNINYSISSKERNLHIHTRKHIEVNIRIIFRRDIRSERLKARKILLR